VVRGAVQGGIAIGGGLTVEESGSVEADIEAQSVAIAGHARGSINAAARVVLSPTGVFEGRLATPVLDLRPGAVLQGRARILGEPSARRRLSH
jgi:cytoskeletal protein CcmA (bactofilin family)